MYVYILLSEICTYLFAYYIYNILIFTFPSEFRPTEPGREHCTPAHNTCCDSFAEFGALEISTTRHCTSLLDCKGRTCCCGAFKHHRNAGFHVVLSSLSFSIMDGELTKPLDSIYSYSSGGLKPPGIFPIFRRWSQGGFGHGFSINYI